MLLCHFNDLSIANSTGNQIWIFVFSDDFPCVVPRESRPFRIRRGKVSSSSIFDSQNREMEMILRRHRVHIKPCIGEEEEKMLWNGNGSWGDDVEVPVVSGETKCKIVVKLNPNFPMRISLSLSALSPQLDYSP